MPATQITHPQLTHLDFGLISGLIGLTLCLTQAVKGHVDARNERERLQEAHEQKMHFLHEFHRQQLHAKDHEIRAKDLEVEAREQRVSALHSERRAREAEERVGRVERGVAGLGGMTGTGVGRAVEGVGGSGRGNEEKERELWRLMGAAREDQEGGEDGAGAVKEVEKNRHQ